MVEAGEDEDVCWDLGKLQKTEESKNGMVILWVDNNIYNTENQSHLAQFMKASNRISRFVCMKNLEAALNCLSKHQIDLIICSGTYSEKMIKTILSNFQKRLPYFQMIMFCSNIQHHQKKAKTYGMLRFATDKPEDICRLINNFKRRIEKSLTRQNGIFIDEFTDPFVSDKELSYIIFIREAGSRFKLKFNKEKIKEQLLKAGYRGGKTENKGDYTIKEIEQTINWTLDKTLFTVYTKECFIYRETNRRLRKYLGLLPKTIFQPANLKLIQELTFDNRAFQTLVPILPFAIELNKQIEQFNSPGIFTKQARFKEGELWRVITLDSQRLDKFKESIGKKIGFPSFSSSSKSQEAIKEFSGNTFMKIIFPIPPKKKYIYPIDISSFSVYEGEEEVLFPAGSIFIIKQCEYDQDLGKVLIILEYFPSPKHYAKMKKLEEYETIDVTNLNHENIISICDTLRTSQKINTIGGN